MCWRSWGRPTRFHPGYHITWAQTLANGSAIALLLRDIYVDRYSNILLLLLRPISALWGEKVWFAATGPSLMIFVFISVKAIQSYKHYVLLRYAPFRSSFSRWATTQDVVFYAAENINTGNLIWEWCTRFTLLPSQLSKVVLLQKSVEMQVLHISEAGNWERL